MKRYLFTLLFLGQITFSFAQRGINYQAVVRDANGKPLSNKDAIVQVSIFDTVNAVLYQEEHYVKSNAVGTVSLLIGNGIATSVGIYNTINPLPWASQQLSTEVKINTGSGFVSFGKMLLQPVPYALVADTALYIKNPKISVQQLKDVDVTNLLANDVLRWNGSKWVRGDSVKVDHLAVRKGLNVHAESEFDKKVKLNAAFSFKNGVQVDSISNDSLLSKSSPTALVTEQATKKYVDNKLKNGINGNVLKDVFKPNDTTLLFTFSDLTTKSVLLQQAKNRTFITNATLYGNGDLVFTFSDTTTLNVGKVISDAPNLALVGDTLEIKGGNKIVLPNKPVQTLFLSDKSLTISGGNTIVLPFKNDQDTLSTNELVTSMTYDKDTLVLNEGTNTKKVAIPIKPNQTLSLTGDSLGISGGNKIQLPSKTVQTLNISGTTLNITGGNSIQLPIKNDQDTLSSNELISSLFFDKDTLTVNENGNTKKVAIPAAKDSQNLTLKGDTLSISGGNEIKLPSKIVQTLSLSGKTLNIAGGNSVELPIKNDQDTLSSNELISSLFFDKDTLTVNENGNTKKVAIPAAKDSQNLTLKGDTLSISGGNEIKLPSKTVQTLTIFGKTLSITGGNSIGLPTDNDQDTSASNELQNLNLVGNTLTISQGNSVILPVGTSQTISRTGNNVTLSNNGGTVSVADQDSISSNELISSVSYSNDTLSINENGNTQKVKIPANTDNQALSISGNLISITGGNTITLPANSGTDSQTLNYNSSSKQLNISNGNSVKLPIVNDQDSIATNELISTLAFANDTLAINENGNVKKVNIPSQSLALSGNNLSISGGNSVTLPAGTSQTISKTGNKATLSNGGGTFSVADQDSLATNELITSLVYANDTLSINENGNQKKVKIPSDKDAQTLSISGNLISITGGNSIALPANSGTDSQTLNYNSSSKLLNISNGNSIKLPIVNDLDSVSTNELITNIVYANDTLSINENGNQKKVKIPANTDSQTLSITGNLITIEGGNTISLPANSGTDSQSLTYNPTTKQLSISNGNVVKLPIVSDLDSVATNELQNLSLTGNTLTISSGNSVILPSGTTQTISQIGTKVTLSNGGGTISVADQDSVATNELQNLSLTGSTLSISSGNSVTLPTAIPQTISRTSNKVNLSNGGGSVSISDQDSVATNEMITSLAYANDTLSINENGNQKKVKIPANTDNQTLSITGNLITIAGGNSITLPANSGTDSQTLTYNPSTKQLIISNGNTLKLPIVSDLDSVATNELQNLSLSGNTLSISNGNSVTLPAGASQTIAKTGNKVTLSNGGGTFSVADQDSLATNELQNLSFSGKTLSISNGNSIVLPIKNDLDTVATNELQSLSLSGNTLSISNGNSVALPVGASQTISKTGNRVTLSNGGGAFSVADQDSLATNELQNLSFSGKTLSISNGNSIVLPIKNDLDTVATNELQSLSLSGNTLSISNGNSVALPVGASQTISKTGNRVTLSNGGGAFSVADQDSLATNELQSLSLTGNTLSISSGNSVILPSAGGAGVFVVSGANVRNDTSNTNFLFSKTKGNIGTTSLYFSTANASLVSDKNLTTTFASGTVPGLNTVSLGVNNVIGQTNNLYVLGSDNQLGTTGINNYVLGKSNTLGSSTTNSNLIAGNNNNITGSNNIILGGNTSGNFLDFGSNGNYIIGDSLGYSEFPGPPPVSSIRTFLLGVGNQGGSTNGYAFGRYLMANSNGVVLGRFNQQVTNSVLTVGNGSSVARSNALTVLDNGRTGIGRTPTTNKLEVEGEASKTTAGSWVGNSDARLKKNIEQLNSDKMLQQLLLLKGVSYEWNDTITKYQRPNGKQLGFIAQNVQNVFPHLVSKDGLGYLQTAYGTYDPVVVEAIRALNDQIMSLKKENDTLKTENTTLKQNQQNFASKADLEKLQKQIEFLMGTASK